MCKWPHKEQQEFNKWFVQNIPTQNVDKLIGFMDKSWFVRLLKAWDVAWNEDTIWSVRKMKACTNLWYWLRKYNVKISCDDYIEFLIGIIECILFGYEGKSLDDDEEIAFYSQRFINLVSGKRPGVLEIQTKMIKEVQQFIESQGDGEFMVLFRSRNGRSMVKSFAKHFSGPVYLKSAFGMFLTRLFVPHLFNIM